MTSLNSMSRDIVQKFDGYQGYPIFNNAYIST